MHVAYNWKTFTFSSLFSLVKTQKLYERREFTTMPWNPAVNLAQSTKELSAVKQDTKTNNFQFSDRFYPSSFHIIVVYSPSLPSLLSLCSGHLKYYAFLCIQSFSRLGYNRSQAATLCSTLNNRLSFSLVRSLFCVVCIVQCIVVFKEKKLAKKFVYRLNNDDAMQMRTRKNERGS